MENAENELDIKPIEPDQKPQKINVKKEIISWILTILVAVGIVFFVRAFIGEVVTVYGISMENTLHQGDRLITSKIYKSLSRNDIVVIHRTDDTDLIKRIIAVPGDVINIDFDTGEVFINDKVVDEPFILEKTTQPLSFYAPIQVPKGYYFVMGDNRNHSDDSRDSKIGLIAEHQIFGKVVFRIYPFSKIGKP